MTGIRLVLLTAAVLGVAGVCVAPASAQREALNTAAGFAQSTTAQATRSFAFVVTQLPGDRVEGAAFVNNPNTGLTYALSLRCFMRQGNEAIIGGIVTAANNPAILGSAFVFAIADDPDVITFTLTNGDASLSCDNALTLTEEPTLDSFVHDFALPSVIQERVTMSPSG
jgi:hypothetical protein